MGVWTKVVDTLLLQTPNAEGVDRTHLAKCSGVQCVCSCLTCLACIFRCRSSVGIGFASIAHGTNRWICSAVVVIRACSTLYTCAYGATAVSYFSEKESTKIFSQIFIKIKAHRGDPLNEQADRWADEGRQSENIRWSSQQIDPSSTGLTKTQHTGAP